MYIIYKTTNIINGMYYIGVHNNKRKGYLGSGMHFKRALKKYGKHNFKRDILFSFETAEEAYNKEAELVSHDEIISEQCYNLKLGGGPASPCGTITVKDSLTGENMGAVSKFHPKVINGEWVHILKGRDTFRAAREKVKDLRKIKTWSRKGYKCSDKTKSKIAEARRGTCASDETKSKMSISQKAVDRNVTLTCPKCHVQGKGSVMKRWHFDKCRN